MDDKNHILEEPAALYDSKVKLCEVAFQPMPQMMETLRAQGYINHEEFVKRIGFKPTDS